MSSMVTKSVTATVAILAISALVSVVSRSDNVYFATDLPPHVMRPHLPSMALDSPSEIVRKLPSRDPHDQEIARKVAKTDGTPLGTDFPAAHNFDFPDVSQWPSSNFTVTVLNEFPRIFLFDNFISEDEAKLLIDFADGRTQPAQIVNSGDTSSRQDYYRNNEQYLTRQQEEIHAPVVNHFVRRIHRATRAPTKDGEGLQFGRYGINQYFFLHDDAVPTHTPRMATFLTYLQAPLRGGATLFTLTEEAANYCAGRKEECCDHPPEGTYLMKPGVGKGVLFYNYDEEAGYTGAKHMACPVKDGVKWVSQRWVRFSDYQAVTYPMDPSVDGVPAEPSGREWDVREISGKNPRIYYVERVFDHASLDDIFRHKALSDEQQRKLDITARSFLRRTVEYLGYPKGQDLLTVPEETYAVILVFVATPGTVIFPQDRTMADDCTKSKSGCCLPNGVGLHVPVAETDALLFYPRKTDNTPETWGDSYAICGDALQVIRVIYFHG